MSVKFKCSLSGNIYEFNTEQDIATMRKHPDYVEVESLEAEEKSKKTVEKSSNTGKGSKKNNNNSDD